MGVMIKKHTTENRNADGIDTRICLRRFLLCRMGSSSLCMCWFRLRQRLMIEEESDDADEGAEGLRRLIRDGTVCDVVDADREAVTDRFILLDLSDA